jgi:hypothetical protein
MAYYLHFSKQLLLQYFLLKTDVDYLLPSISASQVFLPFIIELVLVKRYFEPLDKAK